MKDILYNFTKAISSGITLARNAVYSILPNLYLLNRKNDSDVPLIYSGDYPNIYPQAYGEYLDLIGELFGKPRASQESDENYRQRILFSLTENSTKNGIISTLQFLLRANGIEADVQIIPSYTNAFDGTSSSFDEPFRSASGTYLYGITIFITPKNLEKTTVFVPTTWSYPPDQFVTTTDSNGNAVYEYNVSGELIKIYVWDASKAQVVFNKRQAIYYTKYVEAFNIPSLKYLLDDIVAAGVKVNRVIIKSPGAGGSKGEVYAHTS